MKILSRQHPKIIVFQLISIYKVSMVLYACILNNVKSLNCKHDFDKVCQNHVYHCKNQIVKRQTHTVNVVCKSKLECNQYQRNLEFLELGIVLMRAGITSQQTTNI